MNDFTRHTTKRLFRCHDCGWRGWLEPLEHSSPIEAVADFDLTVLDSPSTFNAA